MYFHLSVFNAVYYHFLAIAVLDTAIAITAYQRGVGEVVEERGEILHIRLAELRFDLVAHHALYVRHRVAFEQPPYTLLVLAAFPQRRVAHRASGGVEFVYLINEVIYKLIVVRLCIVLFRLVFRRFRFPFCPRFARF